MCLVAYYASPTCAHRWLCIRKPCCKGAGFNECAVFKPGGRLEQFIGAPRTTSPGQCPDCDRKGDYDPNNIRMVTSATYVFMREKAGDDEYRAPCTVM
jgi:hypothetical protein